MFLFLHTIDGSRPDAARCGNAAIYTCIFFIRWTIRVILRVVIPLMIHTEDIADSMEMIALSPDARLMRIV
jgi:hypothetical protein